MLINCIDTFPLFHLRGIYKKCLIIEKLDVKRLSSNEKTVGRTKKAGFIQEVQMKINYLYMYYGRVLRREVRLGEYRIFKFLEIKVLEICNYEKLYKSILTKIVLR